MPQRLRHGRPDPAEGAGLADRDRYLSAALLTMSTAIVDASSWML
jgi:hypothetical protein